MRDRLGVRKRCLRVSLSASLVQVTMAGAAAAVVGGLDGQAQDLPLPAVPGRAWATA